MEINQQIFDKFIKRINLGGRLPVEELPNRVRSLFDCIKERANHKIQMVYDSPNRKFVPIHCDFIDNSKVNAVAFTDNQDYIGINAGTVVILYDLFHRMLMHPGILRSVVPAPGYGGDVPYPPPFMPIVADLRLHDIQLKTSSNPDRKAYADILTNMALDFLIDHEIAHLRNGHVDYLCHYSNKAPFIMEAVGKNLNEHLSLTYQTLEMDADSVALQYNFLAILDYSKSIRDKTKNLQSWEKPYIREDIAIFSLLYAIYFVFRIFNQQSWSIDELKTSSHPPTPLRYQMIFELVNKVANKHGYKNFTYRKNKLLRLNRIVLSEAENAIELLTGKRDNLRGIKNALHPKSYSHITALLNHWKIIRPELDSFNRGGNLAP
ncbi:hypothetical protein K9N68_00035 [Kovacikia minuta CCNUW1]|uniref:hypothetical protein n=1 Tax=Kovacikia minuta TaxID=2931930 RepID=UPI001CCBBF9B|nr:hypothetical protein [Kovacikia minuta]UBF26447.1 hypothetical protein K9N68_00035 [Kovacikia minuta CCNUW1]